MQGLGGLPSMSAAYEEPEFSAPIPLPSAFALQAARHALEAEDAPDWRYGTPEQRESLVVNKATWDEATAEGRCATTIADLSVDTARRLLAEPFIAPMGITVIYGRGGTGKGVTATWLIARHVRDGGRAYILDYENHQEEWAERFRALGLTDDELRAIAYRTPYGDHWPADTGRGPLLRIADYVRDDAAAFGASLVVIDSYTTATSTGDANGGADAAQEFATAASRIAVPSLVLAHVPKLAERFPAFPFGSVFAHNLARMTWAVEALPSDDFDPANPYAPSIVRLELRNQKRNRGAKAGAQFLTFAFYQRADGTLERIEASDEHARRTVADLIDAVLDEPMTVAQIAAAIRDDEGQSIAAEALRVALQRAPTRFLEDRTGKRPYRWSRA